MRRQDELRYVSSLFLVPVFVYDYIDARRLGLPTGIFPRTGILYGRSTCEHRGKFYEVEILEIDCQSGAICCLRFY
jgi:hypothetical protein